MVFEDVSAEVRAEKKHELVDNDQAQTKDVCEAGVDDNKEDECVEKKDEW